MPVHLAAAIRRKGAGNEVHRQRARQCAAAAVEKIFSSMSPFFIQPDWQCSASRALAADLHQGKHS